ncbi:hypothetical protein SYNPS1DRAFT_28681 [Syncephalis pseudoplumigaleata]|uniref:Uncharacterized protein n=1 Tax=Syncephalis pseudoplumigaleata TaxID=1712513 RepID=A0A4P9YZQ2_9FUNG|nr:hypothetical protein SYNPS1DRAFT_28681 [Syncephalis pseudoplumigaleata]|eukprot:RKP25584.1 hypothetical protein SYNPS1DRAFT_28681 [Syncephalis pseudoplumigaleata]
MAERMSAVPNITMINELNSDSFTGKESNNVTVPLKWTDNVIDSKYPTQDWRMVEGMQRSTSLNNSWLYMNMLDLRTNYTFSPGAQAWHEHAMVEKTPITQINMSFMLRIRGNPTSPTVQPSAVQFDVFVIDNPGLIPTAKGAGKPFDLNEVAPKARFTARVGSSVNIGFLQSNRHNGSHKETLYDVGFSTTRAAKQDTIEFNIFPTNKPAPDGRGFVVKEEIARRPVSWIQAAGTLGGAISLVIFIFTFLFGQRRLRPWGFIQRHLVRKKMLSLLPQSMVRLKSAYQPELKEESITDVTFLHVPNPRQQGVTTPWMAKPTSEPTFNTTVLSHSALPSTIPEQQPTTIAHPHANEISSLRSIVEAQKAHMEAQRAQVDAQMEAQMKQFANVLNRLAALEGNPNATSTTMMLNSLIGSNNRLPSVSIGQHSKLAMLSSNLASIEARLANLEMYQYRLGTFYLSSDLFDDTALS